MFIVPKEIMEMLFNNKINQNIDMNYLKLLFKKRQGTLTLIKHMDDWDTIAQRKPSQLVKWKLLIGYYPLDI